MYKVLSPCIMSIALDSAVLGPYRTPSSKYQKLDCRGLHSGIYLDDGVIKNKCKQWAQGVALLNT